MNYESLNKLKEFFVIYPSRTYQKGQILLHFDETIDHIFYIESGRVRQYNIADNGTEIIVNIFRKNNIFPVCLALVESPTTYIYEAMSAITIKRAPLNEFMNFFKNSPELILEMLKDLYTVTDKSLKRMTLMMSSNAYERVIFELINESSFYKPKIDGSYHIPMHEYEIAECAGLSRETTSREFKKLINKKFVKVTRKKIIIKNLKKLREEINVFN